MTQDVVKLRFKIGAYTPDTIPMERLAEYMRDLAAMLGEPSAVHFVEMTESSTNIVHAVEFEAYAKVEARVESVRRGNGEVVAMNAYKALNKRLKEDSADGELAEENTPKGAVLLEFPGIKAPEPDCIEPIKQMGTIDGVLIQLGGKDNTVPVRVQDGDTIYRCNTNRKVARQLGAYIYGSELRFVGIGTWLRDEEGNWSLKTFDIHSFESLDTTPLRNVVQELRAIKGEWTEDAWDELREIRHGSDDAN